MGIAGDTSNLSPYDFDAIERMSESFSVPYITNLSKLMIADSP
jgi:hypothetical protein